MSDNTDRKVVLFIALSLDGYIAGPEEDLSFLSKVEKPGEDYGYGSFIETVDTVIMGRKTYDKVLGFGIPFPHSDKKTYIITRHPKASEGNITFYGGDLSLLIRSLKLETGRKIFVDGGAEIVQALLERKLIDELILSFIPCFLGEGVSLFKPGRPQEDWILHGSQTFESGLVQVHYSRT